MLLAGALVGATSPAFAVDTFPMPTCYGGQWRCPVLPNYPGFDERSQQVRDADAEKCKRQPASTLYCKRGLSKVYEEQMRGGIPRLGSPR
jgi:hypothetical protein